MSSNDWGGDGMAPTGHQPPNARPSGLSDEEKRLIFMEAYSAAPARIMAESLKLLQQQIGEGNRDRGFHAEGDELRANAASGHEYDTAMLRNYYMVKVGLIITEAAEGLEDLRSGRPVNENYYTDSDGNEAPRLSVNAKLNKPEGVPSEIADIVIRCFDFADEAGFSLINMILEKLDYNDTRSRLHGKTV